MDKLTEEYADAYSDKILYLANKKLQPREALENRDNLATLLRDLVSEALTKGTAGHGNWSIDELYALIHEIVFSLVENEGDSGWRRVFLDGFIKEHANGSYRYDIKACNPLFSKALSRAVDKIRSEVFAKLPLLEFKKKKPKPKAMELSLKIELEQKKSNFYVKYKCKELHQKHLNLQSDPGIRMKHSFLRLRKELETIEECLRSISEAVVDPNVEAVDPKVETICRVWEECFDSSQKQLIGAIVQHSPATASPAREEQQEQLRQARLQAQSHRRSRGYPASYLQQHQVSHDRIDNENDEDTCSKESESSLEVDWNEGVTVPEKTSESDNDNVKPSKPAVGIFGSNFSIDYPENNVNNASALSKGAAPPTTDTTASERCPSATKKAKTGVDTAAAAAGAGGTLGVAKSTGEENRGPDAAGGTVTSDKSTPVERDGSNGVAALSKRAAPPTTDTTASESCPSATKKAKTGVDTALAAGAEETVETGGENTPVELDGTGDGNAAAEDAPEGTETDDESTGVVWWLHSIVMKRKLECDGTCDEGCGKAALAEWMSSKGDDWYGCKECIDKPSNDG